MTRIVDGLSTVFDRLIHFGTAERQVIPLAEATPERLLREPRLAVRVSDRQAQAIEQRRAARHVSA